ncbi:hypothetical protein ACQ4LE_008623 [Meloidogyne hapla]
MEEKNYLNLKFVKIANKWNKIISLTNCCENKCINTDKPIGKCIKGNGFINITNWENIKYIKCVEGEDKLAGANAENQFKKPEDDINYSMVYFEIKSKIEGEKSNNNWLSFGLCGSNNVIKMDIDDAYVLYKSHNKLKKFKLPTTFSWNDNDIFGFGLVYPPSNKMTELPYFFFTQNGKQIGKALLLNGNCDRYEVVIGLKLCSVETNFGSDLKTKPFIYDITKHSMPKEFYVFDAEDSETDVIGTMGRIFVRAAASAVSELLTDN